MGAYLLLWAFEERIANFSVQREQREARKRELDAIHKVLKAPGPIIEFGAELWNVAVENVTIRSDGRRTFEQKVQLSQFWWVLNQKFAKVTNE